jgi:hypothetical protein
VLQISCTFSCLQRIAFSFVLYFFSLASFNIGQILPQFAASFVFRNEIKLYFFSPPAVHLRILYAINSAVEEGSSSTVARGFLPFSISKDASCEAEIKLTLSKTFAVLIFVFILFRILVAFN